MNGPLIPHSDSDARDLWRLIVDETDQQVISDRSAIRLLASECVAHMSLLVRSHAPGPRVLVLAGPDPRATLRLATVAAHAMDLPRALIPLTALSENGWHGRGLDQWLGDLSRRETWRPWARHGTVILGGLEALRIQYGAYRASSDSTRDYRVGKAENVASLLRGEPTTCEVDDCPWDAQRAMVILTTTYDSCEHDAEALVEWGLTPDLAQLVAPATWIPVPAARGIVAERQIWAALNPLRGLFQTFGVVLDVAAETVRRAAIQAAERGESPTVAASWIATPARRRLAEMLEIGELQSHVVLGPDDTPAPPPGRGTWVD